MSDNLRRYHAIRNALVQAYPAPPTGNLAKGYSLPEIVDQMTAELEKTVIARVLQDTKGNKSKAAKRLQISYKTLQRKLKTYGIKGS